MDNVEKCVYYTLKNLDNSDKLAELFCNHLNYKYNGNLLSIRSWNDQVKSSVQNVNLVAEHDGFHIIHCTTKKLLSGIERPIVNQLLKEHPYCLIAFSDIEYYNWNFVNIKWDNEPKNRSLFRRIIIGSDEKLHNRIHTAAKRISLLDVKSDNMSALELQTIHDKAFDVEEVTKEFFNSFVDMFHLLRKEIKKNNSDLNNDADEIAQMLMNRLLFLYFIQRKGWLDGRKDYLYQKFIEYDGKNLNYYKDFLLLLFQALSIRDFKERKHLGNIPFLNGGLFEVSPVNSKVNFDTKITNHVFKIIFKNLLEKYNFTVREDTPIDIEVAIDPEILGKIFENLIHQIEKGKDIRKITGSYYTPRGIVDFMCKKSLQEYICSESNLNREKIEFLFEMKSADEIDDEQIKTFKNIITINETQLLKELIFKAYILDPAVGSGAFLIGMLHEMIRILKLLDIREKGLDVIKCKNYDYTYKREIIKNSLYGVDIQEKAVRICELRLWLSLIVNYERENNNDVPTLPNLNYKIRCGDSLIERLFNDYVLFDQIVRTADAEKLIDSIGQDKKMYFKIQDIHVKNKKEILIIKKECELIEILLEEIRNKIQKEGIQAFLFGVTLDERKKQEEKEKQLKKYLDLNIQVKSVKKKVEALIESEKYIPLNTIHQLRQRLGIFFLWKLDFAEVFKDRNGFDIIITNPPYRKEREGRSLLIEIQKSELGRFWYEGKMDYWYFFLHRALDLIKKNGLITFITSRYWIGSKGSSKLIKRLKSETQIYMVVDFNKIKVFENVSGQHMITFYQFTKMEKPLIIKEFKNVKGDRNMILSNIYFNNDNDYIKIRSYKNCRNLYVSNKSINLELEEKGKQLLEKININSIALSSHYKVRQGIAQNPDRISPRLSKLYNNKFSPGDGVFIISDEELRKINPSRKEINYIKPFFEESQIDRYYCETRNMFWILYLTPRNIDNIDELPNIKRHLIKFKEIMEVRRETIQGKNSWFHLHWPREEGLFKSDKILALQMASRPTFAYNNIFYYVGFSTNIIVSIGNGELMSLLGILNSRLAHFWFSLNAKRRGIGLDIGGNVLKCFPLKFFNLPQKSLFEELVKKRCNLDLNNNMVVKLESKINEMVYDLYNLDDEEINIIEKTLESQ